MLLINQASLDTIDSIINTLWFIHCYIGFE